MQEVAAPSEEAYTASAEEVHTGSFEEVYAASTEEGAVAVAASIVAEDAEDTSVFIKSEDDFLPRHIICNKSIDEHQSTIKEHLGLVEELAK